MSKRRLRATLILGCIVAAVAVALALASTSSSARAPAVAGAAKADKVIVLIPKQTGDPFFADVRKGATEAAKKLGYTIKYVGPATADAAGQVSTIENAIQLHPVAITIAADDPNAVAPALKRAAQQGIAVSAYNADVRKDARSFFVSQASDQGIAEGIADTMAAQTKNRGHFLLVSSTATAPNQNLWNKLTKAYMAKKYPKMKIDTIIFGNDDPATVLKITTSYLAAHKDITGIIVTGGGMSGAVKAEQRVGLDPHKVPVAGLCIPSDVKPQMHTGLIKNCVLWSPADMGYATVYAINAFLNKKLALKGKGTLSSGKLGKLSVVNGTVTVGKPFIFTAKNIDQFHF
jgi:rhamnose transport system substrate-binding protein